MSAVFNFCGIMLHSSVAEAWVSYDEFSTTSLHSGLSIHVYSNMNCFTPFHLFNACEGLLVNGLI